MVRSRSTHLLIRTTPATVFLAVADLMTIVLFRVDGETDADFDRLMESQLFAWEYTGLLHGLVMLPCVGAWLTARWSRRKVLEPGGTVTAAVIAGAFVTVLPVVDRMVAGDPLVLGVVTQAVTLGILLGAVLVGVGSIAGWALRAALRQTRLLGELTSRALPLLLLFTVLGFFTTEIWQVGATLTRQRLWLVVALFAAVGVVFLWATLKDEVATLTRSQTVPVGLDKLRETPLASFEPAGGPADRLPLTRFERANMVLVLVLTQVLQTLVLATLVFVFFVILGAVSVQDAVIKSWIGRAPTGGAIFGIQLPVSHETLQVSLFFAAFSGLYFAAATVTDTNYRSAFFDPLTDHLAVSLVARDLYLARIGEPGRMQAPPP